MSTSGLLESAALERIAAAILYCARVQAAVALVNDVTAQEFLRRVVRDGYGGSL